MNTTLPQFDPLLHQPLRTQIAAYLAARGEATFSELKQALKATDGNLDSHMTKFTDVGYVKARKQEAATGRAQTVFSLTPAGRKALAAYIAQLHTLMTLSEAAPALPTASQRVRPA
ncbi:hypothetical protein THIX_30805 [Thiomonas sp. X19]|uniref:transcriptional regulator n=1 Tax=Thiomonas sp. X19 TaxID=1050370 RepID=UPI000B758F04|nr:transcriptional regulator [Thiomonas sp. X19]SCC93577.1 hypothetical protein THIX_30805 [Thiomonas sp. X19]